jgi:hypothetical protein
MLSDVDCIRLLAGLHGDADPAGPQGSTLPAWTTLVSSLLGQVGHIHQDGTDTLFWPGTKDALDIWIDGDAFPIDVGKLGKVHAGFLSKPSLLFGRLNALCGPAVRAVGHSLGSAAAEVYAALRLAHGLPVADILAFGSPMPGCQPMKDLLAPVPMRNYQNRLEIRSAQRTDVDCDVDPITTLPYPIPIEFPCLQMRSFTPVFGAPVPGDTGRFRLHHTAQYWAGLKALEHP